MEGIDSLISEYEERIARTKDNIVKVISENTGEIKGCVSGTKRIASDAEATSVKLEEIGNVVRELKERDELTQHRKKVREISEILMERKVLLEVVRDLSAIISSFDEIGKNILCAQFVNAATLVLNTETRFKSVKKYKKATIVKICKDMIEKHKQTLVKAIILYLKEHIVMEGEFKIVFNMDEEISGEELATWKKAMNRKKGGNKYPEPEATKIFQSISEAFLALHMLGSLEAFLNYFSEKFVQIVLSRLIQSDDTNYKYVVTSEIDTASNSSTSPVPGEEPRQNQRIQSALLIVFFESEKPKGPSSSVVVERKKRLFKILAALFGFLRALLRSEVAIQIGQILLPRIIELIQENWSAVLLSKEELQKIGESARFVENFLVKMNFCKPEEKELSNMVKSVNELAFKREKITMLSELRAILREGVSLNDLVLVGLADKSGEGVMCKFPQCYISSSIKRYTDRILSDIEKHRKANTGLSFIYEAVDSSFELYRVCTFQKSLQVHVDEGSAALAHNNWQWVTYIITVVVLILKSWKVREVIGLTQPILEGSVNALHENSSLSCIDLVPALRSKSVRLIEDVMDNEQEVITGIFTSRHIKNFADAEKEDKKKMYSKAINECAARIKRLEHQLRILPFSLYISCMHEILNYLGKTISDMVLTLPDIGKKDSEALHQIFEPITRLHSSMRRDRDHHTIEYLSEHLPSYMKFRVISEILNLGLKEIEELHKDSQLKFFQKRELANLLNALFIKSEGLERLISLIESTHYMRL